MSISGQALALTNGRHLLDMSLLDTFNTDPLLFQNSAFSFRSGWYLNTNFLSSSQAGWCSLGVCRVMNSFAITRVSGIRTMLCEEKPNQSENQALRRCCRWKENAQNQIKNKNLSSHWKGTHSFFLAFMGHATYGFAILKYFYNSS